MRDAVTEIKQRLSIVEVVAPYVELHKAGRHFKGRSPFTSEKTPSFFVSPERGMYYCFSSSQGGDMFSFIEAMEGVDFKGALKILAEKAGVELEPVNPAAKSARDTDYAILESATEYFVVRLNDQPEVVAYLKERGLTAETIAKWRIGYAPGPPAYGWRELKTHLQNQGFKPEEILRTGLIKSASGKEPYDTFRHRVMFPISDASSRVVAFSGRALAKDDNLPKYVNSPETELFHKSEILFGYHLAKQGIRQYDFSLLVEGQFDLVLSHQAGFTNSVAVSGTALSEDHVALLQRLSNRVVLALDSDRAGVAAVKRAAEIMLRRGLDVKVARIEGGKDPADLVLEGGAAALKAAVKNATPVINFLLTVLAQDCKDERTFKLRAREEILPYVLLIPNRIDQQHFIEEIALAIKSKPEAVAFEVERLLEAREQSTNLRTPPVDSSQTVAATPVVPVRSEALKRYLAAALLVIKEELRSPLAAAFLETTGEDLSAYQQALPPTVLSPLVFTLEQNWAEKDEYSIKMELVERLNELVVREAKSGLANSRRKLAEAESAGDNEAPAAVMAEINHYQQKLATTTYSESLFDL